MPETVSTAPTHNFCSLDLLKEDWNSKQSGKQGEGTQGRQGTEGFRRKTEAVLEGAGTAGKGVGTGLDYWAGRGTVVELKEKRLFRGGSGASESAKRDAPDKGSPEQPDSGWGANNPPGIEGWSTRTQLGMFHASQALGLDPFDANSNRLVNEWTAKRSVEIERELKEHYNLPSTATKADVVNAAVAFDQAGRFCAASQGFADKGQAYDGMIRDLVTSDLVERYRTRFSKAK